MEEHFKKRNVNGELSINGHAEMASSNDNLVDSLSEDKEQHLEKISRKYKEINSLAFNNKCLKYEVLTLREALNDIQDCKRIHQETTRNSIAREKYSVAELSNTSLSMEDKFKKCSDESNIDRNSNTIARDDTAVRNHEISPLREDRTNQIGYHMKIGVLKSREAKDADEINALKREISELKSIMIGVPKSSEKNEREADLEATGISSNAEGSILGSSVPLFPFTDIGGKDGFKNLKSNLKLRQDFVGTQKNDKLGTRRNELEEKCEILKKGLDDAINSTAELKDKNELCGLLKKELAEDNNSVEESINREKRGLTFLKNQLEMAQHNNEKLKKDVKYLVAKVSKFEAAFEKSSLALAVVADELKVKDLEINIMKSYLEKVPMLRNHPKEKHTGVSKIKDYSEKVLILRMQVEAYKKHFEDERDAREKQQELLLELNEQNQILMIENHRMQEEMGQKSNRNLANLQQTHGLVRTVGNEIFRDIIGKGNDQRYIIQPSSQQNSRNGVVQ